MNRAAQIKRRLAELERRANERPSVSPQYMARRVLRAARRADELGLLDTGNAAGDQRVRQMSNHELHMAIWPSIDTWERELGLGAFEFEQSSSDHERAGRGASKENSQ